MLCRAPAAGIMWCECECECRILRWLIPNNEADLALVGKQVVVFVLLIIDLIVRLIDDCIIVPCYYANNKM